MQLHLRFQLASPHSGKMEVNMIERIFNGRNGIDSLSVFLIIVAFLFMPFRWMFLLSAAIIIYVIFRCFSKNIYKRRQEAMKFQEGMVKFVRWFSDGAAKIGKRFSYTALKWKNRKTTVYFKCPNCRNRLSLPRHKGKLAVTCTVCGHEFIKKT